jgi:hypothetical protein
MLDRINRVRKSEGYKPFTIKGLESELKLKLYPINAPLSHREKYKKSKKKVKDFKPPNFSPPPKLKGKEIKTLPQPRKKPLPKKVGSRSLKPLPDSGKVIFRFEGEKEYTGTIIKKLPSTVAVMTKEFGRKFIPYGKIVKYIE